MLRGRNSNPRPLARGQPPMCGRETSTSPVSVPASTVRSGLEEVPEPGREPPAKRFLLGQGRQVVQLVRVGPKVVQLLGAVRIEDLRASRGQTHPPVVDVQVPVGADAFVRRDVAASKTAATQVLDDERPSPSKMLIPKE